MTLPPVDPDWWRTIFDEVYLKTDARSVLDTQLTRREVEGLIQGLALRPEETILDLCGGHGRHALELARRGYRRVLVLDFSRPLLTTGRSQARQEGLALTFIRGDARTIPVKDGSYRAVLLLANSFGYGATQRDDLKILRESWRVLQPGGRLFLEAADPEFLRRNLPPQSWHEAPEGLVVCRQRWLNDEYLICRELVLCRTRGLVRDRSYQIRLYPPTQLRTSLEESGVSQIHLTSQTAPYARPGDHGSLSRRLVVTAWK